ncbi:MAG: hypothetical protein U9Q81_07695 [Pseudomonadota bacterium]|nr:hypothetical protein [Pseudomonadota bacterium]
MAEKPNPKDLPPDSGYRRLAQRWSSFLDRLRRRPAVRLIFRIWNRIWTTTRMLWLCGYDVVAVLVVWILFVFNNQGQDLLRISAEQSVSVWNIIFFVSTAALSLTVWFTARLLLGRKFETERLDPSKASWLQIWLPRGLGVAVPLGVAIGLLLLDSDIYRIEIRILSVVYVVLTALVFLFVRFRRDWFGVSGSSLLQDQIEVLQGWYLFSVVAPAILAFFLLVAFMIWPVGLAQWLGAPAIVMLAFVGIVLFGSMVLTYLPLAMGQPRATALAVAFAVVFGLWIDNHYVRLSDHAASLSRLPPAQHYTEWRKTHSNPTLINGREPVILVAAAGGGIRAAYWTATNLAALEAVPGFGENLFAISGVSGGSLGATTYTALKRTLGQPELLAKKVRAVLSQDFLSPVVAGLLFPDLAQRFIPLSIPAADRQRFLELSWEEAMGEAVGAAPNPFADAFANLYDEDKALLPSLLLNTTLVDSGRRAIVSNLDISDFTDTVDLLAVDLSTPAIRLSAAAGASARFTYVSPAGTLIWFQKTPDNNTEEHKLRVVDGGYFENSGAATATDLLVALHKEHADRLFPILILIRNDPTAPMVCQRGTVDDAKDLSGDAASSWSDNLLKEVSAPIRALLHARTARARLAEVDAAREFEANGGAVIELPLAAVLQTAVARAKGDRATLKRLKARAIEPPLGWSLSNDVRNEMDRVLADGHGILSREYAMLHALLQGNQVNYEPCRAR